jgi:lipopolysaccharide biosynthesis glycosyltransferase
MNVAYSCNDYYIPQTGISMLSLFENNKDVDDICVYLISKDVSSDNIHKLQSIADKYHRRFKEVRFEDIAYDLKLSNIGRHIATIYSKVFFSRIEGVDKMIYLDSDTVVVGSLKELWDDNLDGCYLGVVETLPTKFYKELGLTKGDRFFNDGMAICNVAYCRENNLIDKVLKVVNEFNGNPPTLSEGALNKVCYGKVKYISLRYNLMAGLLFLCDLDSEYMSHVLHYSKDELSYSCSNPVVIHYLTAFYNRPWFKDCTHPYKDAYYKYKAMSPWSEEPLKEQPLPFRIRLICWCYRLLGVRYTERLRKLTKCV